MATPLPSNLAERLARKAARARAQLDASAPKSTLMAIVRDLERAGVTEEAKRLNRIIADLEAWQNRP